MKMALVWMRVVLAGCAVISPVTAAAQIYPMPPEVRLEDQNNVDLMGGLPSADIPPISIGDKQNGMSVGLSFDNELYWKSSLESGITIRGEMTLFYTGKKSEKILGYNGAGPNAYSTYSGGRYFCDASSSSMIDRDGVVYTLNTNTSSNCSVGRVLHATLPNGIERTYYYNSGGPQYAVSPLTVVQSNGYVFKTLVDSPTKLRFVLFNANVDSCAPTATQCTFTRVWPTITLEVKAGTIGLSDIYVTRGASELTVLKGDNYDGGGSGYGPYGRLSQIFRPGAGSTPTVSYQLCRKRVPYNCYYYTGSYGIGGSTQVPIPDKVTYSTRNGVTSSYNYVTNIGPVYYQYSSATPGHQGYTMLAYSAYHQSWPVYVDFPGNRRFSFSNSEASRMTSILNGLGDTERYGYDDRGNVVEMRKGATSGSGLPDLVTTVDYPTSCANMATCNKPNSVTDAKSKTTSFTYSAEGLLLTETSPPDSNGIATVKRHSYIQRTPWVRDSGGGFSPTIPIWLLAEDRICKTTATVGNACTGGTADEVVTSYDYGPTSGANNLLLRSMTVTAGGTALKTCFTYDALGNRIATTTPRGSALGGCQ